MDRKQVLCFRNIPEALCLENESADSRQKAQTLSGHLPSAFPSRLRIIFDLKDIVLVLLIYKSKFFSPSKSIPIDVNGTEKRELSFFSMRLSHKRADIAYVAIRDLRGNESNANSFHSDLATEKIRIGLNLI